MYENLSSTSARSNAPAGARTFARRYAIAAASRAYSGETHSRVSREGESEAQPIP